MMLSEKPYHNFVEKTVLNQAGILEKLKKRRRIHQHRQTHFCRGRGPVLHKVSRDFTVFQSSLHASSWLPIKMLKGLWSQDTCPYEEGRGKITGVRQTLDSSYCNSSDPSQPLWSVPEIADLVWSVMSWKGRAELLRSNQMLNSASLSDGWGSSGKIRMIRKNNSKKKWLKENDILKASTSLQHIIWTWISINGSASFPTLPPQTLQK